MPFITPGNHYTVEKGGEISELTQRQALPSLSDQPSSIKNTHTTSKCTQFHPSNKSRWTKIDSNMPVEYSVAIDEKANWKFMDKSDAPTQHPDGDDTGRADGCEYVSNPCSGCH